MRFLFITTKQIVKVSATLSKVILDSSQSKRLSKVLRLQRGDKTMVRILPDGELYEAEISSLKGTKGELILSERPHQSEADLHRELPRTDVSLGMAIIKKKNFELVVQKVSELGVYSITPLEAEHSDTRLVSSFRKDSKRLYDITLEACMQSERPVPLQIIEVSTPVSFAQRAVAEGRRLIVLHEAVNNDPPLNLVGISHIVKADKVESQSKIAVMVGPEGGFSQSEIIALTELGGEVKRVPGFILRAETAAIMAAAIFTLN